MTSSTALASNSKRRCLTGTVVSVKMSKTAVVRVDRRIAHPIYAKYFTVSKKLKVHDPTGAAKLGDLIKFEETRPLSKDKRWRYVTTLKSGQI